MPHRMVGDPQLVAGALLSGRSWLFSRSRLMTVVALDGIALRERGRGVARSMKHLIPLLAKKGGIEYVTLLTKEGDRLLGDFEGNKMVVPTMPTSIWEQFGLPFFARRVGASLIYSLAECAPLWGARVLLHVPEDPYIRWQLMAASSFREYLRRAYQRLTMTAGIRRAPLVIASCGPTANALRARFGEHIAALRIVPLGVDTNLFRASPNPSEDAIFHLGSAESRDQTTTVVQAYSEALKLSPDLPDLVIGGDLGPNMELAHNAAAEAQAVTRVQFLGRVTDTELRHRYANCAICIQLTRYEGFGLQPLEALACGAPVLVPPEAAVLEVVGGAAVIADDGHPSAIAKVIVDLWNDPNRRARLRAAGPRRAAEFSWPDTATRIHDALLQLAPSGGQLT